VKIEEFRLVKILVEREKKKRGVEEIARRKEGIKGRKTREG